MRRLALLLGALAAAAIGAPGDPSGPGMEAPESECGPKPGAPPKPEPSCTPPARARWVCREWEAEGVDFGRVWIAECRLPQPRKK